MEKETLTVLVPCLNEQDNIRATVQEVLDTAPNLDLLLDIYLIDDGSSDNTPEVMKQLCELDDRIRMHVNPKNLGVGRTVLNAYKELPAERWITVFPGDAELIFDSIRNHLAIRHDHDLVLGFLQNSLIRPLHRRLASQSFTRTVNFIYGYPYTYLNGMKLYRGSVFKDIEVISSGHAFNAELLGKALLRNPSLRIGEVPFRARGRATGESKAIKLASITQAMGEVYKGYRSVARFRDLVVQNRDS